VKIHQNTGRYSVKFSSGEGGQFSSDGEKSFGEFFVEENFLENNFTCLHNTTESIISPKTWEINGTSPNDKYKFLLVFYLLPLKATRIQEWNDTSNPKVLEKLPDGPECDQLSIIFVRNFCCFFKFFFQKI